MVVLSGLAWSRLGPPCCGSSVPLERVFQGAILDGALGESSCQTLKQLPYGNFLHIKSLRLERKLAERCQNV